MDSEPAAWQPALDELMERTRLAHAMGGPERVARQHAGGRMTVRERVEHMLDPGTFHEIGAISGSARYDADGNIASFTPAETTGRANLPGGVGISSGLGRGNHRSPQYTRMLLCEFANMAAPLRTPGPSRFAMRL